jgi:ABC-type transport system involved in cytochrome bd biosynthesis fused ATPase/permease subunit
LLTVLLPGYSGIVITLLLSRLLGLHLSGWMIEACAVVGALALSDPGG